MLEGGQRAEQGGQRSAQLVGHDGEQLVGPVARRLLRPDRLVGHREPRFPAARRGRGGRASPAALAAGDGQAGGVLVGCWLAAGVVMA